MSALHVVVVGGGISGLGAALELSRSCSVTLLEKDWRLGGHAHTVVHDDPGVGPLALDTGFLVFNPVTYPRLIALFERLGVAWQPTEMSFSVSCQACGIEYSGRQLWRQPDVIRDRRLRRLLMEIVRFLRTSPPHADDPRYARMTVDGYVSAHGYSSGFRDHFLRPLTAAIWSSGHGHAGEFPAQTALTFYRNHGLLGFRRHQWRNVVGGSTLYVSAISTLLGDAVRGGASVERVERGDHDAMVHVEGAPPLRADAVVLATHPHQALAVLAEPSPAETQVLGALTYTQSVATLHYDDSLLPRRAACRAAWNYQLADCQDPESVPTLTYYLNSLQRLDTERDYMVTLNREADIRPDAVITSIPYEHPQYTAEIDASRARLPELQGYKNTWYAGAYHGYGFHEDGLRSGQEAAHAIMARR